MSTLQGMQVGFMVYDEIQYEADSWIADELLTRADDWTEAGALKVSLKRVYMPGGADLRLTLKTRTVAYTVVSTTMPRLEQWRILQSLVLLVAAKHGVEVKIMNNKMRRVL